MNDINDKELVESLFKVLIRQNISKVNHIDQCSDLFKFAEFGDVTERNRRKSEPEYIERATMQLYNRALALSLVAYKIATHDPDYNFYNIQAMRINNLMQQIKDLEYSILNLTSEEENLGEILNKMGFFEKRGIEYYED